MGDFLQTMPAFGYKDDFVEPIRNASRHASRNPTRDDNSWRNPNRNSAQDGFRTEEHAIYDSERDYSSCISLEETTPSAAEHRSVDAAHHVNYEDGYNQKEFISSSFGYAYDGIPLNNYYDTSQYGSVYDFYGYPPLYGQAMPMQVLSNGLPAHSLTTRLDLPPPMFPPLDMDAQVTNPCACGGPVLQPTCAAPAAYAYGANPGFYSHQGAPTPLQTLYEYGGSTQFVPAVNAVANPPQSLRVQNNVVQLDPTQINVIASQKSGIQPSASGIHSDTSTGIMKVYPPVNHVTCGDTQPNQTVESLCTGFQTMDIKGEEASSKGTETNHVVDDVMKFVGCEQLLKSIHRLSGLLCDKMHKGEVEGPLNGKMFESAIEALLLCFSMDEYADYSISQSFLSFPSSQQTTEKQAFKPPATANSPKDLTAALNLQHDILQACLESKKALCDCRKMLAENQNVLSLLSKTLSEMQSHATITRSKRGVFEEHGVSGDEGGSISDDSIDRNEDKETPARSDAGFEGCARACDQLLPTECENVVVESGEKCAVAEPPTGIHIVETYFEEERTDFSEHDIGPIERTKELINLCDGGAKDMENGTNNAPNQYCKFEGVDTWEYVCS